MKNKTKIIGITLVIALLIFSMMSVNAQSLTIPQPTLWEKIKAFFGTTTFTIVGQDTQASVNPDQTFTVDSGASFSKFTSQTQAYCNGHSGLYDIFRTSGGVNNVPYYEAIDFVEFNCGTWNTECMVQLYCLPYSYPPTDATCNSWRSGYTLTSNYDKTDGSPLVDPTMPLYNFNTQQIITQYFYCKAPTQCTGADKTCWRKKADGTTCESATYNCDYSTYNSIVSSNCASGARTYTFGSQSSCTGSLTTLDRTCTDNGGHWFYTAVQTCQGTIIPSSDTTTNCCSVAGTDIQNTTSQTCAQRNGFICPITSDCSGTWLATSDSQRCCNQQCTATPTCASLGGLCIVPSAAPSGSTDLGQKDCSSSTSCIKVQEVPISVNKSIGDSCSKDTECISAHCDATGWFGLGGNKCSPIPWAEVKKVAVVREEIAKMTTSDALSIACLNNNECIPPSSNYTASCVPIQKLIDDGTLTFSSQSFFSQSQKFVGNVAGGTAIGGLLGLGLCAAGGTTIALTLVPTAGGSAAATPILATFCTAAISGGAIIGAAAGYSTISFSEKDPITSKLKSGDASTVGLCTAEQPTTYCQYTSWAAFFKITGNKCQDGLFIIIGGIFLLALLFRR